MNKNDTFQSGTKRYLECCVPVMAWYMPEVIGVKIFYENLAGRYSNAALRNIVNEVLTKTPLRRVTVRCYKTDCEVYLPIFVSLSERAFNTPAGVVCGIENVCEDTILNLESRHFQQAFDIVGELQSLRVSERKLFGEYKRLPRVSEISLQGLIDMAAHDFDSFIWCWCLGLPLALDHSVLRARLCRIIDEVNLMTEITGPSLKQVVIENALLRSVMLKQPFAPAKSILPWLRFGAIAVMGGIAEGRQVAKEAIRLIMQHELNLALLRDFSILIEALKRPSELEKNIVIQRGKANPVSAMCEKNT